MCSFGIIITQISAARLWSSNTRPNFSSINMLFGYTVFCGQCRILTGCTPRQVLPLYVDNIAHVV